MYFFPNLGVSAFREVDSMHIRTNDIVQVIEAGFTLETQVQAPRSDGIAESQAAIPLLCEKGISENDVRPRVPLAKLLEFFCHIVDRACSIACQNTMRAVRAKFRTTAACQ